MKPLSSHIPSISESILDTDGGLGPIDDFNVLFGTDAHKDGSRLVLGKIGTTAFNNKSKTNWIAELGVEKIEGYNDYYALMAFAGDWGVPNKDTVVTYGVRCI